MTIYTYNQSFNQEITADELFIWQPDSTVIINATITAKHAVIVAENLIITRLGSLIIPPNEGTSAPHNSLLIHQSLIIAGKLDAHHAHIIAGENLVNKGSLNSSHCQINATNVFLLDSGLLKLQTLCAGICELTTVLQVPQTLFWGI